MKDKLSQNILEDDIKNVILASDKFYLRKVIEDGILAVIEVYRTLDIDIGAFLKEVSLDSNP
jgi:hypothetical protein